MMNVVRKRLSVGHFVRLEQTQRSGNIFTEERSTRDRPTACSNNGIHECVENGRQIPSADSSPVPTHSTQTGRQNHLHVFSSYHQPAKDNSRRPLTQSRHQTSIAPVHTRLTLLKRQPRRNNLHVKNNAPIPAKASNKPLYSFKLSKGMLQSNSLSF